MTELKIYNTLSRKKEIFKPLNPPFAGMYVCGPTVYGEAHLGHARPAVTFDILFRYLQHLGYQVRYVRNITDVGHLENDADEGEDKIAKKARLEKLEPMEVVQQYTNSYHECMRALNVLPPSIEPRATGHIIEQQELIKKILENGFAYEKNGSVYFDVEKYNQQHHYGKLSGRKIEDLLSNTRDLQSQAEKPINLDFALWQQAGPQHIMRWPSEWSEGFPGWHLECTTMSNKYLGDVFDIHGGGMDLLFPHHDCEIAQSIAGTGHESVRYWIHNNMVTINGQKMGKSLGNFITLNEFFNGNHQSLDQAYSPMTIRFFILQAHYRSTLDFSNEALQAAEKGLERLMASLNTIEKLAISNSSTVDISKIRKKCFTAMNDDLNTPVVISQLFEAVKLINLIHDNKEKIDKEGIEELKELFSIFIYDILGLVNEKTDKASESLQNGLIKILLDLRIKAKNNKDYAAADAIRNKLSELGVIVKDTKDGYEWEIQ
jgi:cysteinyl-tRNA synthetase